MQDKKVYEQPFEEIIFFQETDVVKTSSDTTGKGVDPFLYDPYDDQWEDELI